MSVREQYVKDRDAYLKKKDQEAVLATQVANKILDEKVARGEQIAPQVPSKKWQKIIRFDPTEPEHNKIAWLRPMRVIDSEETGKLLRLDLPIEAEPLIEDRIRRQ